MPAFAKYGKVKAKYSSQFFRLLLFTIDEGFGGWTKAEKAVGWPQMRCPESAF